MNFKKGSLALSLVAALAWLATSTVGCGGATPESLCEEACACDASLCEAPNDCVAQLENTKKLAEAAGCSAEYDASFDCYAANMECNDGMVDTSVCDQKGVALTNCMNDGQPN